jgi:hypothetical protein
MLTYTHSLQPTIQRQSIQSRVRNRLESFHIKSQDSDVDVPLFFLPIVHITISQDHATKSDFRKNYCDPLFKIDASHHWIITKDSLVSA